MAFCSNCGAQLSNDTCFCPTCGAQVGQAPVQQQGYYPPMQPIYVKPKVPGRGLGIAGMVLGIIGLVYAFYAIVFTIQALDSYWYSSVFEDAIPAFLVFSVLSILAVSFGGAAKNKGYRCGVSSSGIAMGVIGLTLYLICIILLATY